MIYILAIILKFSGEGVKNSLTVGGIGPLVIWNHVTGIRTIAIVIIVILWHWASTSMPLVLDGGEPSLIGRTIGKKATSLMDFMEESGNFTTRRRLQCGSASSLAPLAYRNDGIGSYCSLVCYCEIEPIVGT